MQVFIIWSGDISKAVAKELHDWLPNIIQAVKAWMSEEDIDKGAKWYRELDEKLKEPSFGIVCLTPDNLTAPWILYESGALANSLSNARISPYLFELKKADISGPLAQLMMTEAEEVDTLKLLKSINRSIEENAIDDKVLEKAFKTHWPEFKKKLDEIKRQKEEKLKVIKTERRPEEKIDEILQIVRLLVREYKENLEKRIDEQTNRMFQTLLKLIPNEEEMPGLRKLALKRESRPSVGLRRMMGIQDETIDVNEAKKELKKVKDDKSE